VGAAFEASPSGAGACGEGALRSPPIHGAAVTCPRGVPAVAASLSDKL